MNMSSVGLFLYVIGMSLGGLEGRGAFDWINDYMHNALDAEVLPGE